MKSANMATNKLYERKINIEADFSGDPYKYQNYVKKIECRYNIIGLIRAL